MEPRFASAALASFRNAGADQALPGCLGAEVGDRAALGDNRRVGRRADVLLDPFRGAPRGLVCAGLVLADRHSATTLAAPESCVADEAGEPPMSSLISSFLCSS